MKISMLNATTVTLVTAIGSTVNAGIVGFVGDTTLEGGWYAFEDEFDVDMTVINHGGAAFETVYGIDVPEFGGSLDFDEAHSLRHMGQGWSMWSHGYMGEVFYNNGAIEMGYDLNMVGVFAFDAYIGHSLGALHDFEVTAYGAAGGEATVLLKNVMGFWGSRHFGFYSTGETIQRIEIMVTGDWAMGEWRVGAPSPGALALLAVAGLCRIRRRRI